MNLLMLILLIPLSFAGSPPDCGELGRILEQYEKDLQKKFVSDCGQVDYKQFTKDIPVVDPEFLKGRVCSDLSTIETELENLKLQEAVLSGINKLKTSIDDSKQKTKDQNPEIQRVAGMSFAASLNTAQSLEVLLQSLTDDGTPFIKKLKDFPEYKRSTASDLQKRIDEICIGKKKNQKDACNPKLFQPGKEATEELLLLVKNTEPDIKQISKWQGMLAIQKKNPAEDEDPSYSFTEMQNKLGTAFYRLDQNEVLTKDQIKAIQELEDFESAKGFSFIEDLDAITKEKKVKIASDKFFLLMGDAKMRQQFEIQSKMSVIWDNNQNALSSISASEKTLCVEAKSNFLAAKGCLSALEKAMPDLSGDTKSNFTRLLPALRTASNYADSLEQKEVSCREEIKQKSSLSEACYADFNKDLAQVQDQILQLNLLKDKIGSENIEQMRFRNFALMKWGSQKCQGISSSMDFCDDPLAISKEATLTYSDAMNVAILFAPKPEAEVEAKMLCEDERKFKKNEERLCEFFNDTTDVIVKTKNEDVDGPVAAPDGGNDEANIRDAWVQGGASLLTQALGTMLNNPYRNQYTNPYPYNYNPYTSVKAPFGMDPVLFNARYYGAYGFYMPTPGYQPYTAFGVGSGIAPYNTTAPSTGTYFSF